MAGGRFTLDRSYFQAREIAENIFHIYEPGGVYTSLIIGEERALLIDTGYGFEDIAAFVKTLTDKPLTVVLTHGHLDHAGGAFLFPDVYMNLEDVPTYLWYMETQKTLTIAKFKRDRAAAGRPMPWPEEFDQAGYLKKQTESFEPLENGQIFDLGGRKEEIIFLPGHTMGSVMICDDLTGLLFSGDDISNSLWIFFDHSAPLALYVSGLKEIMKRPFAGVVYAHDERIYPVSIMDDLLMTIGCIDPEQDRVFTHPRTGQKALMHKEPCRAVPEKKYVYIVYQKDKMR